MDVTPYNREIVEELYGWCVPNECKHIETDFPVTAADGSEVAIVVKARVIWEAKQIPADFWGRSELATTYADVRIDDVLAYDPSTGNCNPIPLDNLDIDVLERGLRDELNAA